jgi:hypothetical protein
MECFPISRQADGYQAVSGSLGFRSKRARLLGFGDYNRGSVIDVGESGPFALTFQHFYSPAHIEHLLENFLVFAHAVFACEGV